MMRPERKVVADPACKTADPTPGSYLFLVGPNGGRPRRSNYAGRFLTPTAEGLDPPRCGTGPLSNSPPDPGPASPSATATARTRQPARPTSPGPASPARSPAVNAGTPTPGFDVTALIASSGLPRPAGDESSAALRASPARSPKQPVGQRRSGRPSVLPPYGN